MRIAYPWIPSAEWKPLLLDVGVGLSLLYLFRSMQVSRALEAWYFLKRKAHQIMRRQLSLALASDLLRLISIPFAGLWLWRWRAGIESIYANAPTVREFNFIDSFIFCLFLAYFLDTQKFRRWLFKMHLTSGRQILIQYTVTILLGSFLLVMPSSVVEGKALSLIDSMFITISALSVTGLTPVDVGTVLTFSGQVILLILIQLGGLGIVLITAGFSFMTFRRLSMNSILLGREMYSTCRAGEVPDFLTRVVVVTLLTEMLGTVALYFSLPADTPNRLFTATFHAVSAFCNAGFSTYSAGLHETVFHSFGIVTICLLITIGGLGFPIILDLWSSFQKRQRVIRFLSPHARLTLYMMSLLFVLGPIVFFLLESLRPEADLGVWQRIANAVFYSISARTAGFNLFLVDAFHPSALFWLILLMAIGANPSSTGGGMKTTTIGVLITAVVRTIQGHSQITFNGRAIPQQTFARALTVVVLYISVAGLAVTLLVISENLPPFSLAFEVISALSTVGLTMSVTAKLTVFGKIVIMFLMLFGRIGILSFLLAGLGNTTSTKVTYPEDDFFVG